jgi:hypothetical protein
MSGRGDIEGQTSVKERLLFWLGGGGGGGGGRRRRRAEEAAAEGDSGFSFAFLVVSKRNQSTVLHFKHKNLQDPWEKAESFLLLDCGLFLL